MQSSRECELYLQVLCGLACDVTEPQQLATVTAAIAELLPDKSIGAVFANANVIFSHTVLNSTVQEWQTTLQVNVMGVVRHHAGIRPAVAGTGGTSLIFAATASIGGLVRGDNGGASYQASKHAVVATSEALSFELYTVSHPTFECMCCALVLSCWL